MSNPNSPQANQTKRNTREKPSMGQKMFNYKQSARCWSLVAGRTTQNCKQKWLQMLKIIRTHTPIHTTGSALQLCRTITKPIRSQPEPIRSLQNKHKYDTELFFAFDKNNAHWTRRKEEEGETIETATVSNFISHIFTAIRYGLLVSWAKGSRRSPEFTL